MEQRPLAQSVPAVQALSSFNLQAPLALQVWLPVQLSGSSTLVVITQVPPAPVQLEQAPHVWVQHLLSTHDPLLHWVAV
jgi:hypothetical protein